MKSLFGTAIFLVCVSLVSSQTWDFDFYANNQNCDGSSKISTVVVAVPGNSCFRVPAYNDFFTIRWVDSVGDFVLARGCSAQPLTDYIYPFNNVCMFGQDQSASTKLVMRNCSASIRAIPRISGGNWTNSGKFYQIYDLTVTNYSPASCALNNATARILMDEAEVESSWNIDNLHMYLTNPNNINFWQGEINLFGDLGVGQSNTAGGMIVSIPLDQVVYSYVNVVSALLECNDENAPQCSGTNITPM